MMFGEHPRLVSEKLVDGLQLLKFRRSLPKFEARIEPGPDIRARARWKARLELDRVAGNELGTGVSGGSLETNKRMSVMSSKPIIFSSNSILAFQLISVAGFS